MILQLDFCESTFHALTRVNKARRRAEAARDVRPSHRGLLVLLLRRSR